MGRRCWRLWPLASKTLPPSLHASLPPNLQTLPLLNVPMPAPPRMEPKDGDWRGRRLWTLASKTLRLLRLPLPTRHVARQKVMIGNGSGVRWTGAMIGMEFMEGRFSLYLYSKLFEMPTGDI